MYKRQDHVNEMNPNPHQGMIYCSNLCSEIAQNMSAMDILPYEEVQVCLLYTSRCV